MYSLIKKPSHLVNELRDLKVEKEDIMVIFVVVFLFTKIPMDEAIEIIGNITYEEIANLVNTCLKFIYFSFKGNIYE